MRKRVAEPGSFEDRLRNLEDDFQKISGGATASPSSTRTVIPSYIGHNLEVGGVLTAEQIRSRGDVISFVSGETGSSTVADIFAGSITISQNKVLNHEATAASFNIIKANGMINPAAIDGGIATSFSDIDGSPDDNQALVDKFGTKADAGHTHDGLYVGRETQSDAYLFWDEVVDQWGQRLGAAGTFDRALFASELFPAADAQSLGINSSVVFGGLNVNSDRILLGGNEAFANVDYGNGGNNNFYIGTNTDGRFGDSGTKDNIFVGPSAGRDVSGVRNIGIGQSAMKSAGNSIGDTVSRSVAIGNEAMARAQGVIQNVAIGEATLKDLRSGGNYNTAIGGRSQNKSITGNGNVSIGYSSLKLNTDGNSNTVIGTNALYNAQGESNIAIGRNAGNETVGGLSNVNISYSTYIGQNTVASADGNSNEIVIGYGAIGKGSNTAVLGNDSITQTYLKGNVSVSGILTADEIRSTGDVIAFYSGTGSSTLADISAGNMTIGTNGTLKHEDTAASFSIIKTNGYINPAAIDGGVVADWGDINLNPFELHTPTDFAPATHVHNQYLTALPSHTHDDRYYTEAETNTLLSTYDSHIANVSNPHDVSRSQLGLATTDDVTFNTGIFTGGISPTISPVGPEVLGPNYPADFQLMDRNGVTGWPTNSAAGIVATMRSTYGSAQVAFDRGVTDDIYRTRLFYRVERDANAWQSWREVVTVEPDDTVYTPHVNISNTLTVGELAEFNGGAQFTIDTLDASIAPSSYPSGLSSMVVYSSTAGYPDIGATGQAWTFGEQFDNNLQLFNVRAGTTDYSQQQLYYRIGNNDGTTWRPFRKIIAEFDGKVTINGTDPEGFNLNVNGTSQFKGDVTVIGTLTANEIRSTGDVIAFYSGTGSTTLADISAGNITIGTAGTLKHEDTAALFSIVKANGYVDPAAIDGGVVADWGDINLNPFELKTPADFAPATHTHDQYLTAIPSHTHTESDITDLKSYALASHNHDGTYEPVFTKGTAFNKDFGTLAGTVAEGNHSHSWSEIGFKPTTFTPSAHTHDGRYYTETEVDNLLSGKSDTSHTHGHFTNTTNPHSVTKAQVGLGNVRNVSSYSQAEADNNFLKLRGSLGDSNVSPGDTTNWPMDPLGGTYSVSYGGHSGTVLMSHEKGGSAASIGIEFTYNGDMFYHSNTDSNRWSTFRVWTDGSDGAGSGLDADKLDAQHGSYYRNASNINNGTIADTYLPSTMSGKTFSSNVTVNGILTANEIRSTGDVIAFYSGTGSTTLADISAGNITIGTAGTLKHEDTAALFSIVKANGYINPAAIEGGVAADWADLNNNPFELKTPADFAPATHTHSQYLTALPSHNHDGRYYTETEINTQMSGKANTSGTYSGLRAQSTTKGDVGLGNIPNLTQFQIHQGQSATALSGTDDLNALSDGWYRWGYNTNPVNSAEDTSIMVQVDDTSQDIQMVFTGRTIRTRRADSGTFHGWINYWNTGNFDPSSKADSSHTHGYADLPFGSNTYMPKSGGTFTGNVNISGGLLSVGNGGYDTRITGGVQLLDYGNTSLNSGCFYFQNGEWVFRGGGTGTSTSSSDTALKVRSGGINRKVFHEGHYPTWGEVASKPSTFAPSSHSHSYGDLPISSTNVSNWNKAYNWGNSVDSITLSSESRAQGLGAGTTVYSTSYPHLAGFRDGGGTALTYQQALADAAKYGARLPTIEELEAEIVKGSGYGYDSNMTWTCSSAGPGKVYANLGTGNGTRVILDIATDTAAGGYVVNKDGYANNNVSNWDNAYNGNITSHSWVGGGNGSLALTLNKRGGGGNTVGVDLSHTHGYADLPFSSNTYMPKSGGTFSGAVNIVGLIFGSANDIAENSTSNSDGARVYYDGDYIGTYNDYLVIDKTDSSNTPDGGIVFTHTGGDGVRQETLRLLGNDVYANTLYDGGNRVWSTGNFTPSDYMPKAGGNFSGYIGVTNGHIGATKSGEPHRALLGVSTINNEFIVGGSTSGSTATLDTYLRMGQSDKLQYISSGNTRNVYHEGHKPSWSEVSGKPGTFTPSSHTHNGHDVKVLGHRLTVDSDGKVRANNSGYRRAGMYGTYDSYKIGHVWSMGNSYTIDSNGATFGNLYGIAYKHTNNTTGGSMAGSHQIVFCQNGNPRAAIGLNGGFWTTGTITANGYNDNNWNSAYNDVITGVSGHGDGTLTLTRRDGGTVTTSLAHTHGEYIRSNANDNVTGHTEWQDNYNIRFGNSADQRLWHSGGHLYIRNYNHANGNFYFQGEDSEGTNHALMYLITNTSRPYVRLYENGYERLKTTSGGVSVTGSMTASGEVTAFSDRRKKFNIRSLPYGLPDLMNLRSTIFQRNDIEGYPTQVGFIAQDMKQIMPEVVRQSDEGTYSLAYGKLTTLLVKATQELKQEKDREIDELKTANNQLMHRIEKLEQIILR